MTSVNKIIGIRLTSKTPLFHSQRKLSTGSKWAARAAGAVPNSTPTRLETSTAMITDQPETGTR